MDTHELTGRVIECEKSIAAHGEELKTLFQQQKQITEIAESTNRLAVSVEKLATQMSNHEDRLAEIEDNSKYKGRTIWACVVTGLIGAAVGYLVTALLG